MHGIPYAKVTSKQRKEGKGLNFGTSYGLQDKALALMLFGDDSEPYQLKAYEARSKYFAGVPNVLKYFEEQRDIAQETCYARTKFGRRRFIPQFEKAKKVTGRERDILIGKGRRVAGNMPVQGLAADIMKLAMIRTRANFRKYGFYEEDVRLVLNVHDELCVQVKIGIHPDLIIKIMREAMEIDFSHWGLPPLYIGGNVGYSWLDGKADHLEAPVDLMDRMVKKATEKLEKNEDFDFLTDPRTYWEKEITKYNLEVLDTQSKTGYLDPDDPEEKRILPIHNIDDALKSVRIAKYTTHDSFYGGGKSRGTFILGMVMLRGHQFVWENLDFLLNSGDGFAIDILNKVKQKYTDYEEARNSLLVRTSAEWFAFSGYGGDILHVALTHPKDIQKVEFSSSGKGKFKKLSCKITDVEGTELLLEESKYKLTPPKRKLEGQELQEHLLSLKKEVESMVEVDENQSKILLHASKINPKTLDKILRLLIDNRSLNEMLIDKSKKKYQLHVRLSNVEKDKVYYSKRMVSEFVPVMKNLIYFDLTETNEDEMLMTRVERISNAIFKKQ